MEGILQIEFIKPWRWLVVWTVIWRAGWIFMLLILSINIASALLQDLHTYILEWPHDQVPPECFANTPNLSTIQHTSVDYINGSKYTFSNFSI